MINIELFDAETVRRMVEYLYTKDYDELEENSQGLSFSSQNVALGKF